MMRLGSNKDKEGSIPSVPGYFNSPSKKRQHYLHNLRKGRSSIDSIIRGFAFLPEIRGVVIDNLEYVRRAIDIELKKLTPHA